MVVHGAARRSHGATSADLKKHRRARQSTLAHQTFRIWHLHLASALHHSLDSYFAPTHTQPTRQARTMSDNERPLDHQRDSRREPRGGRDRDNERSNTGSDRRKRSRSPRGDRGGRRDGGRYRSRSPFRRDERDSDRGRGDRGRSDGGGRNNDRNNDRAPPPGPRSTGARGAPPAARPPPKAVKPERFDDEESKDVTMKEQPARPEGMDDETWEMAQTMGFAGFKSTKNTKVPGNDRNYGVRRDKQMEARQYMNRQGGFNRPLSPGRG